MKFTSKTSITRFYWFPKWLNCITWKAGTPKIYRWGWWNIEIGKTTPIKKYPYSYQVRTVDGTIVAIFEGSPKGLKEAERFLEESDYRWCNIILARL